MHSRILAPRRAARDSRRHAGCSYRVYFACPLFHVKHVAGSWSLTPNRRGRETVCSPREATVGGRDMNSFSVKRRVGATL